MKKKIKLNKFFDPYKTSNAFYRRYRWEALDRVRSLVNRFVIAHRNACVAMEKRLQAKTWDPDYNAVCRAALLAAVNCHKYMSVCHRAMPVGWRFKVTEKTVTKRISEIQVTDSQGDTHHYWFSWK